MGVLQHREQGVGHGLAAALAHRAALAEAHHAVVRRHDLAHLGVIESGYAPHVGDNDGMERVVIKVRHNGPYKVTGPIRLIDADGNEFEIPEGDGIVLCRCGASTTKPFCDKTHSKIGFEGAEKAVRDSGGGDP